MERDQPFFLGVGFVRPHVPLIAPQKYYDLYDRDSMTPPFAPENDLEDLPKVIRDDMTNQAYGVTTKELHQGLLEGYYASISYMDAQVGKLLDTLDSTGLSSNTMIVFSSDHGYHVGDHHKFQKRHLFEETTRVPFIVSVPWMSQQNGRQCTKMTELIDLYPTLAELTGLPVPTGLQGTSLTPLLQDVDSTTWTKYQAFTVSVKGGESLRTDQWRFTQWGHGKDGFELYDLKNDPGEFTNVASHPEYTQVVRELKNQLIAKRSEAGFQGQATLDHAKRERTTKKKSSKTVRSKKGGEAMKVVQ